MEATVKLYDTGWKLWTDRRSGGGGVPWVGDTVTLSFETDFVHAGGKGRVWEYLEVRVTGGDARGGYRGEIAGAPRPIYASAEFLRRGNAVAGAGIAFTLRNVIEIEDPA